jgi:hypothetical protein
MSYLCYLRNWFVTRSTNSIYHQLKRMTQIVINYNKLARSNKSTTNEDPRLLI